MLRGVFHCFDTILAATVGSELHVQSHCLEYFLFCEVTSNWWIDTAPSGTNSIGKWNKTLLLRIGSKPRGYSSHRSGFVSRACILGIRHSKGTELSPGLMDMMVRAGGWQAVTGAKTVLRVYARQIIDEHLDVYAMSLGIVSSGMDCDKKLQLYLGQPEFPLSPIVDRGREDIPLQLRVMVWRSDEWQRHLTAMNAACKAIMEAATQDERIMPVKRYKELRQAFSHCKKHDSYRNPTVVATLELLLLTRPAVWKACVRDVKRTCLHAFVNNRSVARLNYTSHVQLLADVRVGYVCPLDGVVDCAIVDPSWDKQARFAWAGSADVVALT